MQQTANKSIEVWTELVDAIVFHEYASGKAWKFKLGNRECSTPKSASRYEDHRLYVDRNFAVKKQREWNAKFVPGSQQRMMCAMDETALTELREAVRVAVDAVQRAAKKLEEYEAAIKPNNTEC